MNEKPSKKYKLTGRHTGFDCEHCRILALHMHLAYVASYLTENACSQGFNWTSENKTIQNKLMLMLLFFYTLLNITNLVNYTLLSMIL